MKAVRKLRDALEAASVPEKREILDALKKELPATDLMHTRASLGLIQAEELDLESLCAVVEAEMRDLAAALKKVTGAEAVKAGGSPGVAGLVKDGALRPYDIDVDAALKEKVAPVTMAVLKAALSAKSFSEDNRRRAAWVANVDRQFAVTADMCGADAVIKDMPWVGEVLPAWNSSKWTGSTAP